MASLVTTFSETLRPVSRMILDGLIPPRCVGCSQLSEEAGRLCPDCWQKIRFITDPYCEVCGLPFDYAAEADMTCGQCAAEPPPFNLARSAFRYDDTSRPLVTGFKFGDKTYKAPALADMLQRAGQSLLKDADMIVPIPLHRRRLLTRRYNQAALLAAALADRTGLPMIPDLMIRSRHTTPQTGLNRRQRQLNVRGAFYIRPAAAALLRDRIIVLIDDVYTTGATLKSCSKTLLRAGAGEVRALTLARAVQTEAT